jgi:hypothetical protein
MRGGRDETEGGRDETDRDGMGAGDGKKALRDIVQFVPFRDFKHDPALLSAQVNLPLTLLNLNPEPLTLLNLNPEPCTAGREP